MKRFVPILSLSTVIALGAGQPVKAGDTLCLGALSGGHDNVVVPEGADCVLSDAVVAGNVEVKPTGSLTIGRDTYVRGNVQSDGGNFVRVIGPGVVIGGDMQIKKAIEWSGYEPGIRIRGNFQYEENLGLLRAYGGVIRGDFQVFKNTGGAEIAGNSISKNLQCKENFPPPSGGGNRAGGEKEEQCSGL